MKLLVASRNFKKLKELKSILSNALSRTQGEAKTRFEIVSLGDFPNVPEVQEDGKTFEENAVKKALGYAKETGLLTLADDSGLVVDALGGEPGVLSARFAGADKDDRKNCLKVLRLLESVPDFKRTARFVCAIAIAKPDQLIGTAKGEAEGFILKDFKGSAGFGYDPIFYYPPFEKTFAEVNPDQKNSVSHRNAALKVAQLILAQYLTK